tara:strand:+ start:1647 stop:1904 length:258 start_codon:yes stop_codon:yes gene_type:complete
MKKLKITEIVFDPKETEPTLEDEFIMTAITRELESLNDPKKLKMAALHLLFVSVQRQAIIRGLCKRLADSGLDEEDVVTTEHEGR